MSDDVLVKCENVSKKFCRGLKRSLLYGVQDICTELNPFKSSSVSFNRGTLTKLRKDEFWAINDISFELKRGECLGLIGHNGAGKSTLLKLLNGLIKPDCGKITMKGRIGALIELNTGFNPILTGRENVYIYGTILGFTKKEIDQKFDDIVEFAEMADFMEMPLRSYSSGMKVRLGFAVAAQMEPDVLLIDEVLAVGDVGFKIKCINRINSLLNSTAVIFVSHNMVQLGSICDKAILLKNGTCHNYSSKVNEIIEQYSMLTSKASNNIIGAENIMVENIRLQNSGRHDVNKIRFGEDVYLLFNLRINNKKLTKISVYCTIWDNEYKPIIDVITENDARYIIDIKKEYYSIILHIPSLRLNFGKHLITIHIYDEVTNERVFRIDHIAPLYMEKIFSSGAATLSKAKWDLVQ